MKQWNLILIDFVFIFFIHVYEQKKLKFYFPTSVIELSDLLKSLNLKALATSKIKLLQSLEFEKLSNFWILILLNQWKSETCTQWTHLAVLWKNFKLLLSQRWRNENVANIKSLGSYPFYSRKFSLTTLWKMNIWSGLNGGHEEFPNTVHKFASRLVIAKSAFENR